MSHVLVAGKEINAVLLEVMQRLVKQGEQCFLEDSSSCAYGNEAGQHCAIGWMMDPETCGEAMAECEDNIDGLVETHELLQDANKGLLEFLEEHGMILMALQRVHDATAYLPFKKAWDDLYEQRARTPGDSHEEKAEGIDALIAEWGRGLAKTHGWENTIGG